MSGIWRWKRSRHLDDFGGLATTSPVFSVLLVCLVLAAVGLPGTAGFVGEFLILKALWASNGPGAAFLGGLGVILSAAYALWLFARVVYGKTEKHALEAIPDLDAREIAILAPLALLVIYFGVQPNAILSMSQASVDALLAAMKAVMPVKAAGLGSMPIFGVAP
jgi:NADH-quinone oxidoreductase subunit M